MKLLVVLFAVMSSTLMAGEIKVMSLSESQARWGIANIEQSFDINAELGRAWVNVSVYESMGETSMYSEDYRVKIEGMSFNAQTGSVNIDHEGQIVECAKLVSKGRWVFRHKKLQMSERCKFSQKWVTTTFDDGFEIQKRNTLHLSLIVE